MIVNSLRKRMRFRKRMRIWFISRVRYVFFVDSGRYQIICASQGTGAAAFRWPPGDARLQRLLR
jgi:hypothetical protein